MGPVARGRPGVAAAALVAFLAGALAHADSLSYWFVSSDTVPLVETGRRGPVAVFTEPMMAGTRFVEFALFYRPLASLSYAVDYHLWGLDPAGYHLTNVLLHGTAAAAATVALVVVTRRLAAGALGGLLFAIHPLTAEVVPAASRRHDVLMTVFLLGALVLFVQGREQDSRIGGRPALAGSLVLYVLALLAKEPALIFPGLVVAWVALGYERPWQRPALRATARAVAPFAAVTAAYLALRIAVLGSLGGYKARGDPTPHDLLMVVVEYPISLGYHHGVVGYGTIEGAGLAWHLLAAAMALVGAAVLAAVAVTIRRRGVDLPSVAALGCAAALVAVPAAVALEPAIRAGVLYDYGKPTVVWAYPRPSSPVAGLLLVAAALAAGAWAITDRSSAATAHDRRALLFFAAWLVGPLILFLQSGNYTPRSGYASLVPTTGALGLLAAVGVDGIREWTGRRNDDMTTTDAANDASSTVSVANGGPSTADVTNGSPSTAEGANGALPVADVALVGVALLLIVPAVATTPLVHDYDDWETVGQVNEATLVGVGNATEGTPDGADVRIEGMVRIITDRGCGFPRAKTVQFARPGTVESWLRLHGEQRRVRSIDDRVLNGTPDAVHVDGGYRDGNVSVTVSYEGIGANDSCVATPWERYAT